MRLDGGGDPSSQFKHWGVARKFGAAAQRLLLISVSPRIYVYLPPRVYRIRVSIGYTHNLIAPENNHATMYLLLLETSYYYSPLRDLKY